MYRFLLLITVIKAAAAPPPIRFEEIAAQAGLRFELQNDEGGGFHQIELTLGGVAAFDYNNDGCTDIFFTNGAAIPSLRKSSPKFSNRLFRNNCNLTFTDSTAEANLAGEGYAMAVATADYDNDGFADLFVAGVKGNTLYRNLGNGRFAASPLPNPDASKWAVSAGWFDYDNDGWLDLFVANYVVWNAATEPRCGTPDRQYYCHPNAYQGLPNQLFHNNHDGTFTDVSAASGIGRQIGKGMGVSFADFDGDGEQDFVTGKRIYAHASEPGATAEPCLFLYRFDRPSSTWIKQVVYSGDPAPLAPPNPEERDAMKDFRPGSAGTGLQMAIHDIDGDGDLDIVAPGKSGLYWFENPTHHTP